jgi:hypothetical protein
MLLGEGNDMRLNSTCKTIILGAVVGLAFSGCGLLKGPISPIINPPIASFGSFDTGSIGNWSFETSNPIKMKVEDTFPLVITSQPALQGLGALEVRIPPIWAGQNLVSYSVKTTFSFPGPVTVLDLTNKTISMWVYWKSGIVDAPGEIGGQIFIMSTADKWANGSFVKLARQRWIQVTFNTSSLSETDKPNLTLINKIGLQIAGSGSTYFTSEGVIVADSLGYQ